MEPVRVDKWLWAVRLFRTRTAATAACSAGKVFINGQRAKPSREVRIGDTIVADNGDVTRTVKVVAFLGQRVGAKLVSDYAEDLTPASEYEKRREPNLTPVSLRPRGAGRPTKKDRRQWEEAME